MELERYRESDAEATENLKKRTLTRPELMVKASEMIELLHTRTTAKTFRARKDDTQRLAFARATLQAVQAYAGLLKDAELEDLAARLDAIEQERI